MALDPSIDIDARTGANISGWPHVLQSLEDIFTTGFGEQIMREWYGSAVPRLLGENLNKETIVSFFVAVCTAVEQWEPRFRITKITPVSVDRSGAFVVTLEGEYRPLALLGDFTPEGARRVTVGNAGGRIEVSN